jgi:hypothetical protein
MTQDEIIEMWKNSGDLEILGIPYNKIEAFAKLVAQHEREACAKLCEEMYLSGDMDTGLAEEAILARGQA